MEDLFEHQDKLPKEVVALLDNYVDGEGMDYADCKQLLKEMKKLGYTFEYGLDAEPFNLKRIDTKQYAKNMQNAPQGSVVTQGNRTFIKVSKYAWYIHKIDDKYYNGKAFQYYPCIICGQLTCHMMGGLARHIKMHTRKGEN